MAAAGVTIIKEFDYRGATEEWSNTYHLTNSPADDAAWRDLTDALIALEKTVFSGRVTIVRALCYDDTDNASIYTYHLVDFGGVVVGTFIPDAAVATPGDTAGWVRWATGGVSSRGKPIYLRKYYHDVYVDTAPDEDSIAGTQVALYQALGDALLLPIIEGFGLATPAGSAPAGPARAATYATTRTLKRRGPRPS